MIKCKCYMCYIVIFLRKQEVLFTAISRCANASANAKTLMMLYS